MSLTFRSRKFLLFPYHADVSLFCDVSINSSSSAPSFSATEANPAFFLDILKSGVSFKDVEAGAVVATASVASVLGTPLQHTLSVTYGPAGSLNYSIVNSQTQKPIFNYIKANGSVGAGGN